MFRTRIKICGLTTACDASAAVAAGADAAGVILAPSPRQVTIDQASAVLTAVPPFVSRIGVFVDPDPAFVAEAVAKLGLHAVQLSGTESPDLCSEIAALRTETGNTPVHVFPVVKALRVGKGFGIADIEPYRGCVAALLLDTFVAGAHGGTGRTFNWQVASVVPADMPLVLAGGLASHNVAEAIRTVRPFAVDVSSGVESVPGMKDHSKIRSFVAAVHAADEEVRSQ